MAGGALTDALIITQAKKVSEKFEIKELKFSFGWLSRLKKHYSLKQYQISGEAYGLKIEGFNEHLEYLKIKINEYGAKNVYNADETGLYYRAMPEKTIPYKSKSGFKKLKDRVSILLCCNADGIYKRKVLIIRKSKSPRCLANFNNKKYISYYNLESAWMNARIFIDWLTKWNFELIKERRKICLWIDNCPSQKNLVEFSNIEVCIYQKTQQAYYSLLIRALYGVLSQK